MYVGMYINTRPDLFERLYRTIDWSYVRLRRTVKGVSQRMTGLAGLEISMLKPPEAHLVLASTLWGWPTPSLPWQESANMGS